MELGYLSLSSNEDHITASRQSIGNSPIVKTFTGDELGWYVNQKECTTCCGESSIERDGGNSNYKDNENG